ncbi:ABC transporter permease [Leucobacter sp. GX24907]
MNRFTRSLSSEFRKVTATKIWWILGAVIAAYSAMMALTFAFLFSDMFASINEAALASADAETAASASMPALPADVDLAGIVYSTASTFGYVVPLIFGALMATGELRHRTLGLTFAAEPRRGVVLGAKTVVLLGVGFVLGLLGLIGAIAGGAPILAIDGHGAGFDSGETWLLCLRVVTGLAIWAVVGFGLGLLVRNQVFAIVLALVFTQFLEPVLRAGAQFWDWSAEVAKYLPGAATDAFVGASVMSSVSTGDASMPDASAAAESAATLGVWGGLAVLVAYGVVTIALGWWLRWTRDVTV